MIVLFTDFGLAGPYVGQMHAVLAQQAPAVRIIDLMHEAPRCDPRSSAYLLAALVPTLPVGSTFLGVVDPGVGSDRRPLILQAGESWFVGPDNGLFEIVLRRHANNRAWEITDLPERLSASFHGRDLFAPVAAKLANGAAPPGHEVDLDSIRTPDWPDDLDRIVYIDHFGNAITGRRATTVPPEANLYAGGFRCPRARTFSDQAPGEAFWYENSNGLVEIAVNQGRADQDLKLAVGAQVQIGEASMTSRTS